MCVCVCVLGAVNDSFPRLTLLYLQPPWSLETSAALQTSFQYPPWACHSWKEKRLHIRPATWLLFSLLPSSPLPHPLLVRWFIIVGQAWVSSAFLIFFLWLHKPWGCLLFHEHSKQNQAVQLSLDIHHHTCWQIAPVKEATTATCMLGLNFTLEWISSAYEC